MCEDCDRENPLAIFVGLIWATLGTALMVAGAGYLVWRLL